MTRLHLDDLDDDGDSCRAFETDATQRRGPLGLLPEMLAASSAATISSLERLDDADLSDATDAVRDADVLRGHDPATVTLELKRFLALHVVAGDLDRGFVPVEVVDAVWHELILDTRRYRRFCEEVFGSYLDHVPARGYPGEVVFDDAEAARDTVELLTACFGEPDPLWAPLRHA